MDGMDSWIIIAVPVYNCVNSISIIFFIFISAITLKPLMFKLNINQGYYQVPLSGSIDPEECNKVLMAPN